MNQPSPTSPQSATQTRRDFIHLVRDPTSGIEAVMAEFHGHAYDMHHHEEWLIGVTHHGVQDFFCRGRRVQSTAGRVILIEPGEVHDGQAVQEGGFRYSMIYLPQARLRAELGGSDAAIGFQDTLADDRRLGHAIAGACDAIRLRTPRLAREAAVDEVLRLLHRHLGRSDPAWPDPASSVAERAMDYLRAHSDSQFGLDELAREAGAADRFQLSRAFRQRFGAPPHAYLVQLRLAAARRLLRDQLPPAEAAMASGFADQSHMGRWFRRAYGLTPAAYRAGRTNVPDAVLTIG